MIAIGKITTTRANKKKRKEELFYTICCCNTSRWQKYIENPLNLNVSDSRVREIVIQKRNAQFGIAKRRTYTIHMFVYSVARLVWLMDDVSAGMLLLVLMLLVCTFVMPYQRILRFSVIGSDKQQQ